MKYLPRFVASMFGLAMLLGFFSAPALADPTITISSVQVPPNNVPVIPFTDLDNKLLCDGKQGDCSHIVVVNLSNRLDFTDFHITVDPAQLVRIIGNGGDVFQHADGTNSSVDFSIGQSSGVPRGAFFLITTSGFSADTVFRGNPTASIPEPSTMLLLVTGLSGIVVYLRYKFS